MTKIGFFAFFAVLILFLLTFFTFYRQKQKISYNFSNQASAIEEKKNILFEALGKEKKMMEFVPQREEKISFLFNISQKLIGLSDSDDVLDYVLTCCRNLFPHADNILLFLLDNERDSLNLVRAFKIKQITITEKHGDILDKWVLRHNCSLLIDDLSKDFRFDFRKVTAFSQRDCHSFVSSPFSIGEKIIGIIRIESKNVSGFSLEDSRILRSICDLSAIVLERLNLFKRIEELAITDSLTSVFLRDYFFIRLREEIKRAKRKKSRLGIIMLDIDNFKKVNDNYGHVVGDLVLKRLAKIMSQIINAGQAGNIISRFGGEEFLCLIVECDKENVRQLAEKIRSEVESTQLTFRKKHIKFTVSLGAVVYPDDGVELLDLIDKVDHLLYQAKTTGKNRLCIE